MSLRFFIVSVTSVLLILASCSTENKKDYELTTSVSPANSGTVSPETGFYDDGDSLKITATPNEHWVFERWEGAYSGSENPAKLEVHQDMDLTAMFTERTYPLNIDIQGEGTVSEQIIQQKSEEYPNGTLVELTANPADGWHFLEWRGDLSGTERTKEIMISGETNVTALFSFDIIKTFGGSMSDGAVSLDFTADAGMVLTGSSSSTDGDFEGLSRGDYFSYVLKLSSVAGKEWINTFNGSENYETASSVIQTRDRGYLFVGNTFPDESESDIIGQGEVFVTKLNASGDIEWSNILWGSNRDDAAGVVEAPDGSIYIAGQTGSEDGDFSGSYTNSMDAFVTKLTAEGSIVWTKIYGGSGNDYFRSVDFTADGNIVLSGISESNDGDLEGKNNGLEDAFVLKINNSGEILWVTTVGGSFLDFGNELFPSANGGFLLTGSTESDDGDFTGLSNGYIKTFVSKISSSGEKEWTTVYEGDFSIMRGYSLVENDKGDVFVTGFSNSNTEIYHPEIQIDAQIMVLKINSTGSVEWFKTFGGSGDDYGYSIVQCENNTVIIAGRSNSTDDIFTGLNHGDHDIFVMRLNEEGELISF